MSDLLPILILAAGASSRMRGADKLLELVDGVPLLQAQITKATALGCPVFVALPSPDHPRNVCLSTDTTPLYIPKAAEGMGASLRGGIAELPPCPAFMILLGDLPAIEVSDLIAVRDAWLQNPDHLIWRGATQDGKPGHPIIFDASLRPKFADLKGDTGGEPIVNPLKDQTMLIRRPGNRARLDLDTPEDWAAWRADTGR